MVRLRSPQVKVLRNLLALLLVLPLLLSVFALFSLGPAVPEAQAATLCPEFKSGSLSPSDVAVNPNKIREEDTVAKACSAGGIIGWVKCKIAEFFTDLRGTGDLDLRDSQMPAYLRRANELALSGDLEKREEPGGITGSIAKMLPPGYKQDNLDPIKELTESEGQLVTGKIFLNNNALQKTFTETVYEEPDLNSVKGYYDLEVGSGNSNYQVEGRFGEVAPLYDRFGLLKQALLPFAGEVGIPTDDCIGYDPSIIAVTGFNQANPLRDVPWTAFQPIPEADRQPVDVQCTQTGTSTCPEGASNYATPTICTIGCSGTCVNSNVGVKKCCCPTGKVCSVFTPIYSCPATAGTKTYEVGGNLDVQTQVSLASETWERIGAVSSNPGEGGVFNVLLPPGTSFRTDQAKPQLKFDYAPHTQAQYSDGSTLNIASLGNVGEAVDCLIYGLTAHPADARPQACAEVLESGFSGLAGDCPEGGQEITAQLAAQMQDGHEQLLPNTVTARSDAGRMCITPTMIIIHWSGGWDNDQGNDATYGTLIQRNLACQLASDTNDIIIMQPFYETQVELPWCAGTWNVYSINNELAGGYVPSPLEPEYGSVDIRFTDESGNPSRIGNPYKPSQTVFPEKSVVDHAVSATCAIMKQYNIPWTQIYGHYQVPGSGKPDPGREFLEDYFIPRVKNECY